MFKPSLRKSILNDNLCIESQKKHTLFETSNEVKQRPMNKRVLVGGQSRNIVDVPSMMIPQRLLSETKFDMDHHPDMRVFTPFTYDFRAYPRAVRQFISHNPNAAQAGKCQQINYVVYEKCLFLWIDNKKNRNAIPLSTSPLSQQNVLLKMHKFSQPIDLVQFSIISNAKIFTSSKAIVLAVVFKNRMKLFIVDSKQLSLQDMMLKYQLKGANRIQHVYFTDNNELIFAGDNGKLSMISLNGNTSAIVSVQQSNILKKYLSKSAFDYSTVYNIRQITSANNFVYCLYDRIKKENYLLYIIKKAVNKVVKLQHQPKYIIDETFVDVYKFSESKQKKSINLVERIAQNLVQQKVKQGYSQFTGESVKDGFRIVAVRPNINNSNNKLIMGEIKKQSTDKSSEMRPQDEKDKVKIVEENTHGIMQIVTKCGYLISLIHAGNEQGKIQTKINNPSSQTHTSSKLKQNDYQNQQQKQQITFVQQPIKLPSTIGQSHLFQPKLFSTNQMQKSYRKNFVIKSIPSRNNNDMVLLMNDSIMRIGKDGQVNVIKFGDLKVKVTQTTVKRQIYVNREEYDKKYNKLLKTEKSHSQQSRHQQHSQKGLFPQPSTHTVTNYKPQYYRLFNSQRRFTSFDNQGRMDVYLLQLRHVLISYLSYYLEAKARNSDNKDSQSTLMMLNGGVDYDIKLQKILQKIVNTYGYCRTIKSLMQILTLNNNQDRQFIYFQRSLLIDTIRKEFESQQSSSIFQEWNYSLNHHQESQLIVVNDLILEHVWSLVFEWNLRVPLGREIVRKVPFIKQKQGKQWVDDIRTQQKYTAYGNALQSIFNQQFQILSNIRAREFKQKQAIIKASQSKLVRLYEIIEQKNKKSLHYRHVVETKLLSNRKKQQQRQQFNGNKYKLQQSLLSSSTLNTTLNNQQMTMYFGEDDKLNKTLFSDIYTAQGNSIVQESIIKAIQKIVTLIDVMNLLIEKDERQGVPSFVQILTQFKSQLKCGQLLFNQQLFMDENNTATFLHPQLVQRVLRTLPQFQLDKKIQLLKFKLSRNLINKTTVNQQNNTLQIDLKSLDLQRLAKLVASNNLLEMNKTFLSKQMKSFSLNRAEYYIQFLAISLTNLIAKVNQLVDIKQLKFNTLSQEVKKINNLEQQKSTKGLIANYSVEKILLAEQKLSYYQSQMLVFYQQAVKIFKRCVDYLAKITGPEYYEAQKYLDRIIQILVSTFPNEQVLIQTIKVILKDANMVDKVQYVRTIRKRMQKVNGVGRIFVDLGQENGARQVERSTFQYLLNKNGKQSNNQHDRTIDTWRNTQHSTLERRTDLNY